MINFFEKTRIYSKHVWRVARLAPVLFLSLWLGGFFIVFAVLFQVQLVPDAFRSEEQTEEPTLAEEIEQADDGVVLAAETKQEATLSEEAAFLPKRIIIDAADVDVDVLNPQTTNIDALNTQLQSGSVRYPGSGDLEDISNMFIFGHSSYLPSVINKNYQAFNGIQDLNKGDVIRIQSETHEYIYVVETVEMVSADDAWVSFQTGEKTLTLSTCNTFGSKQDRHVVTSKYVGKYEIRQ